MILTDRFTKRVDEPNPYICKACNRPIVPWVGGGWRHASSGHLRIIGKHTAEPKEIPAKVSPK